MPKISVIIPTHNRPEQLARAIRSVLKQTLTDFELVVVDDGLKNRAQDLVESFGDSRIKYVAHEVERGGAAARNTGIKQAGGEFVAFLDDDDEWRPDKLAVQMAAFAHTPPEVGFCYTAVTMEYPDRQFNTVITDGIRDFSTYVLRWFSEFLTVTLVFKKEVIMEIGGFDEKFPSHQESDLMIRVCQKFKGLGINNPLTVVHVSEQSVGSDLSKRIAGRKMILEKHAHLYAAHPKILAVHYFQLGIMIRNSGDLKEASVYFRKALKTDFSFLYLRHSCSTVGNGFLYRLFHG